MRLFVLSLLSVTLLSPLIGCSHHMPAVGANNTHMPMNANAVGAYPSADAPRYMSTPPAFNPPQFYRTSYIPSAY